MIGNILKRLFARRSLENPSTSLSDPDEWVWDAFGASKTASGIRINRKTALEYAPVWKAVTLISRDVAKLPLMVFERTADGKQRATAHPAFPLLRHKPNSEMTSFAFRQTLMGHVLLQGNGYAYIFRNGAGSPTDIIPLSPDVTYPVRENGKLWYVTQVNGGETKLQPENVLHIKGLGFDGLVGYSVIQKARESLALGVASRDYGSRYFRNNARPSVVLEHPGKLTDEAAKRLRAQWDKMHSGIDNAHKTAVLEEGLKANPFSINAKDSQLLETRAFEIREVANWFSVPGHKLGDTSRTSFSSLEQENQSYLDEGLDGWLVNWEEECRDKLLTEQQKNTDTHFVEFLRQALVRVDMKTRAEFYGKALGGYPWMLIDEVRSLENMNFLPGGQGQELLIPANIQGGGDKNARDTADALAQAHRQIIRDSVRRMVTLLGVRAERANKKGTLAEWLKGCADEHKTTVKASLAPGITAAFAARNKGGNPDDIIAAFFERYRRSFASGDASSIPDEIADMVLKGE